MTQQPAWRPDDGRSTRLITVEIEAKTIGKMKKEGHADEFTVFCDESERLGGENTAPSPMRYLALSAAF